MRPSRASRNISAPKLAAALIVIIIAALVVFYVLGSAGTINVNGATTFNITASPTVLRMGNGTYAMSLASAAGSAAYVHVAKAPTIANPMLNVTLFLSQSTRVNLGSSYANMELRLDSIGSNVITLTVSPISASLGLSADSARIATVKSSLPDLQHTQNATILISTTATTTVQSTTTVTATNTTYAKIMSTLEKTLYYPLMLNYSKLYANTSNCTASMYNTKYVLVKAQQPSGPTTYANISQEVPYALYSNITSAGSGVYLVKYYTRTRDPFFNNSAALTVSINADAQTLQSAAFSGIFQGSNYSTLYNGYLRAKSIGGACAAYVT